MVEGEFENKSGQGQLNGMPKEIQGHSMFPFIALLKWIPDLTVKDAKDAKELELTKLWLADNGLEVCDALERMITAGRDKGFIDGAEWYSLWEHINKVRVTLREGDDS